MNEPTTAAERREMREEAEAARGGEESGGICAGLLSVDPKRLLALLDEREDLAAENERLREALAVSERDANALMERLSEPAPSDKAAAERSVCVEHESGGNAVSLQSTPGNFIVVARGLGDHDADIIAGSMQNILEGILSDHVAQLRAELAADRAAARALVEALPECDMGGCDDPATTEFWRDFEDRTIACDTHRYEVSGDLDYAAPLRALQARMATWGAGDGHSAPAADPAAQCPRNMAETERYAHHMVAFLAAMSDPSPDTLATFSELAETDRRHGLDRDDLPGPDDAPDSSTNHRWGHLPGCLWDAGSRSWGCVPGCPRMEPPTRRELSSRPVETEPVSDAGRRTLDRMRAITAVWAEAEVPPVPPEPEGDEETAYDVGAEGMRRETGDRFRVRARRAGPLPGSMMAVCPEDQGEDT